MKIESHVSLQTYNTFGIDVKSKKFIGIQSTDALKAVLTENQDGQARRFHVMKQVPSDQ